jgi:co-chaperonin GroES (HSP10)
VIRPLGKNVLIAPIAEEKVSPGGLHIVSAKKNAVSRAKVVSIAKGVEGVAEGDTILYESHAPTVEAGEGRLIVSVDYIAAVLA